MKLTQAVVVLTTVIAWSAGAAHAGILPLNCSAMDNAGSGWQSASTSIAGSSAAPSFFSASATEASAGASFGDDEDEKRRKKRELWLVPVGLAAGTALLADSMFFGGGPDALNRSNGPLPTPPAPGPPDDPAVAPVPELSSSLLVLAGLSGLALWNRRRVVAVG